MRPLESHVDVFIIGAGPAGIMCANALAMAGIDVRVIDIRPTTIAAGHADGIQQRMIEVLQSYGLAERLIREGHEVYMPYGFYNPGPNGGIECTERGPVVSALPARYPFAVTLHQGAIESIFIDSMKSYGVQVERPRCPSAIEISEDPNELSSLSSYPVKITVEHLDVTDDKSKAEIIHAKFVVGADGAHSWVRKSLGIRMEGEQTEHIWGVIDMIPETNFPDVRIFTTIHSTNGSAMIIPRERDMIRLYIQLSDGGVIDSTGRVDKSRMDVQKLLSIARKILQPYKLDDPKHVDWWTIYTIGQRVASSYSVKERVFIAGDACHTHSPKAGQGMNASMNDTHNLAWKLAQVIRGWASPLLLKTYEAERMQFAQDLINFDRKWAALYTEKPRTAENEDGVSHEELVQAFKQFRGFTTGIGVHYPPSTIVNPKHQKYADNLVIGEGMFPQIFLRAADMRPIEIQDLLPADTRFKVLLFVGNLTEKRITELDLLAGELDKPSSFLHKYSAHGKFAVVFDITTITTGKKDDVNYNYLLVPAFFRPHWTKVLLDDTDATGTIGGYGYSKYGIDPEHITLVIVRPDGYVGTIAPATALEDLDHYFGSFLIPRGLAN